MESHQEKHDARMRVARSLTNISPDEGKIVRIEGVREAGKLLAAAIIDSSDSSRERSLALTHLEETVMWAVKSIILEKGD
jgi:hypothetical protein